MIGRLSRTLLGTAVFALIFFLAGEIFLRLYFHSGESFTSHGGPIVERFERHFVFNGFDGPSRGPEPAKPKSPGELRVLVQGDSITWGQGVRHEHDLFTSRLLERLRDDRPDVEMAVLAHPGREIDDHIEQLGRWGESVAPDVVVYLWFANDMELRHEGRPGARGRIWRRLPFHRALWSHSYAWFFLDFALDRVLPRGSESYEDYLATEYRTGSPRWRESTAAFRDWFQRAKSLTPNVLIALYPMSNSEGERALETVYSAFEQLCETEGVAVIDLWPSLSPLAKQNRLYASRYDSHPGVAAHEAIAAALHGKLQEGQLIPVAGPVR